MTLLIDSGNTRIKLGWCHPLSGARESQPVSVHADQLDQLAVWLEASQAPLQEFAQQKGVQALGVNVAGPQVQAQIDAAVSRLGLGPVRWLQAQEQAFGLHNDYEQAGQLGADRWASLLGLSDLLTQEYPVDQGALLISFGTATTIDLLGPAQNGVRHFLGGSILPGPSLMLASLKQNTAQLPEAHGQTAAFPRNTQEAISTGVAAAQAGAVLRQWEKGRQHLGHSPLVFLAGGGRALAQQELLEQLSHHCRLLNIEPPHLHELETPALRGLSLFVAHP
ncbi:type III pantothenate kinase [Alcaligenes nematophilus]|jgi:type III pantothenate kinase|uniref:Type III pantothenate kinase n=3 Tax=Alcaligenes nematophilus TaxID=2994643 RepID=A0ABU3MWH2_9BURK|nr:MULTISPECIES: type III pantothenate kinase [Alcaligenes]MDT8466404.1 type III pantothenate kinase [Alcaligenes nematophilus]MDT8469739.1 type III pantothenate kinase [Alcaligenes nematophilus]MDT8506078.1 type III pantothenate kinase [Alcaligenes nematophilus]QCP82468.1 type III pantothenate kinase [Alcaligenes faecalis]